MSPYRTTYGVGDTEPGLYRLTLEEAVSLAHRAGWQVFEVWFRENSVGRSEVMAWCHWAPRRRGK